jgi:hypothetical protein
MNCETWIEPKSQKGGAVRNQKRTGLEIIRENDNPNPPKLRL